MKSMHWRTCALAALLPLWNAAPAETTDPANAAAGVPTARYESVFKTYRPAIDDPTSPDKQWRAANEAVTTRPGEDHMMGMQMDGAATTPKHQDMNMPPAAPTGAKSMPGMDMSRQHHGKEHGQ